MKTYRSRTTVEAMRWIDTDENRELFADWFEDHGAMFMTLGHIALLPDLVTRDGCDTDQVQPGEWIVRSNSSFGSVFTAMTNEEFQANYVEAVGS